MSFTFVSSLINLIHSKQLVLLHPLSRFILMLELAVRFGKTLLLQDVQSIDPILYPILRRDLAGQGVYKAVQVSIL
jgi:dynein heavy chain 2